MPRFVAPGQRMAVDFWALLAKEVCVLESHGIITNQRDSSWQAAPPRALTESRLKHIQCLSMKKTYLLVLKVRHKG